MTKDEEIAERLERAQKVLIGIGEDWKGAPRARYEELAALLEEKDYFVVTTLTDGLTWDGPLDRNRTVAPCGNVHWLQCANACTKDIWEEGEVADGLCPHCGAPLVGNTVEAENYIEEGYLPQWEACKRWQTGALNRELLVLELGEGFKRPTVIRWPFEKIAYYNKKAFFCRVGLRFPQLPQEEGLERAESLKEDSQALIGRLLQERRARSGR